MSSEPAQGLVVHTAAWEQQITAAREQVLETVCLHAQQHAADFYARAGFVPEGERFTEAGIPHIAMRRDTGLGKVYGNGIAYPEPFARWAVALCRNASREICILSHGCAFWSATIGP